MGCVADAATIRERADGTFEVLATGTTRVRLLSVDASGPFLTAELEELPEDPGDEAGALAEGVLRAFRQYQKRLAGARERSLSTGADLPDEPSVVSYLVAAAMMLDTPAKQRLLQAPDTASRLREELKLLRAETAIIRNLPSLPASDLTRGADEPQLTHEEAADGEEAEEAAVRRHARDRGPDGGGRGVHRARLRPRPGATRRTARRRPRRWASPPTGSSRPWWRTSTAP